MVWALSNLDENDVDKIKKLEEETGIQLLSFSNYNIDFAELNDEQTKKIQELEKKLDVSLVAVSK
ncbi:MAG: hypothetical protein BTN85_0096 [Candidatus Methanohalarchaeum thermophilum]|uniref:Uncharacterized protein n=1 Tax=Methanohalarchaeum thermophilum TaxID=1903181 RepID=A0A1Q6DTH2_METT1|nr:MAG: hypothetical protein BTN85_0096 [Candidatus Methanohalarchaeum thermophilum]